MKVAFVYSEGRVQRGKDMRQGPSDFFYGAREFRDAGHYVSLLETGPEVKNPWVSAYNKLFPFLTPARANGASFWQAHSLLPQLQEFDCVVATYAQSALGLGLWKNLGYLRPALVGIQCGLVNYPLPPLRRMTTSWLLKNQFTALFATSELPEMEARYAIPKERLRSCEFGVDLSFWKPAKTGTRENYVLAVGNDGRRDYETLVKAAGDCSCEVRVVTKRELPDNLPANVKKCEGDWHRQALSDEELRMQYQNALCVIVPLSESIQPSGQSVAMQAMACGTPVILTRTSGYWGDGWLEDGRDIVLVPPGNAQSLSAAINRLQNNSGDAAQIGLNGLNAMQRQGGAKNFAANLLQLCRDAVVAEAARK